MYGGQTDYPTFAPGPRGGATGAPLGGTGYGLSPVSQQFSSPYEAASYQQAPAAAAGTVVNPYDTGAQSYQTVSAHQPVHSGQPAYSGQAYDPYAGQYAGGAAATMLAGTASNPWQSQQHAVPMPVPMAVPQYLSPQQSGGMQLQQQRSYAVPAPHPIAGQTSQPGYGAVSRYTPTTAQNRNLRGGPNTGRHYWAVNPTNPQIRLMVRVGRSKPTPIHIELFKDDAPHTVANFTSLCMRGQKGSFLRGSQTAPGYIGSKAFRLRPGSAVFFGDFGRGDGTGGIPPEKSQLRSGLIAERPHGKTRPHFGPGAVSFVCDGPSAHTSVFFITLGEAAEYDGRHVVFGQVLGGYKALSSIAHVGITSAKSQKPQLPIEIVGVEKLPPNKACMLPGGMVWDEEAQRAVDVDEYQQRATPAVAHDPHGLPGAPDRFGGGGVSGVTDAHGAAQRERAEPPPGVHLPDGWEAARDNGQLYYWNRRTRERSWDPPPTVCCRCTQPIAEYPTRHEGRFYHTSCFADAQDGIPLGQPAVWEGQQVVGAPHGSALGSTFAHSSFVGPGVATHTPAYAPQYGAVAGLPPPPEAELVALAQEYHESYDELRALWNDEAAWRAARGYDPYPNLTELRAIVAAKARARGL